ncbi:MAG TPA: hypothetical protein PKH33_05730 [bacterium]|nr:hypothetical protein [bacterium]
MMFDEIDDNVFRHGNILCAPVVHSRYYFALRAQRLIEEFKPEIIAVEFPQALKRLIIQGVKRLPNLTVACASQDGEDYSYIPIDPCDAIVHSVRIGLERRIPVHFIDLNRFDLAGPELRHTPDDWALPRIGAAAYYEKTMERVPLSEIGSLDYMREQHMAASLRRLNCFERRVLFVCGMIHWERIREMLESGGGFEYFDLEEPDALSFLANLHPESAKEVLEEIPAVAGRFESARIIGEMDRNEEVAKLIEQAEDEAGRISTSAKTALHRYLRKLCATSLQFTPDLVDLLTAAKCVCGDEFAHALMEIATRYPHCEPDPSLPDIYIVRRFEQSDEGMIGRKTVKLNRRRNTTWKRNMKRVTLRRRPPELYEGEWRDVWDLSSMHVSHTPEDIRLEDYNSFIRDRAIMSMTEDRTRVVEFTTSILDGIDMRETLRNAATGKIYVKETPSARGSVGPVTVIFDQDNLDKYPWRAVWHSEFSYESDLLMMTTPPGETLVGPGISQCRFGGFTSVYPPRGMANYWAVYDALREKGFARNEADLLLYAAIMNSQERFVAYVAKYPPSSILKNIAQSKGVHIVFIPISTLNPESVSKLQRFHVLGDKRIRRIAEKYIF